MKPKRAIATEQIHHPYQPPEGWAAMPVGVFKASTVLFKDTADLHQYRPRDGKSYRYGLHGTPTSYTLAARLATLEGAEHCLLTPSGLSAVTLVSLGLLSPGDEVLIPDNVYGQNRHLCTGFLPRLGITHRVYDPLDVLAFEALLGERTKLVWLEAAGSITLEFPDLIGLIRACKARGITTALDNTWGAGVAFQPFDLLPGREPGFGVGHVVDFLQIPLLPAIFNLADVAIVSSMALFLILTIRGVGLDGRRTGEDEDVDADTDALDDADAPVADDAVVEAPADAPAEAEHPEKPQP